MQYGKYAGIGSFLVILVLLVGCGKPPVLNKENIDNFDFVVAEFKPDYSLTAPEVYEDLYYSRYAQGGGLIDEATVDNFVDSVVIDTLVSLESMKFDLSKYFYDYRTFRIAWHDKLIRRFWDEMFPPGGITVDSQEVVDFFNQNPQLFNVHEQVDLYHILSSPSAFLYLADSALARKMTREELQVLAREYAFNIYRMLLMGEPFQNLAYAFSHDVTSREEGGYMGWVTKGSYRDPFDSVAFALEAGEFSKPYKDEDGWHLLYIEGHLPSGPVPLDSPSVWQSAVNSLITVKRNTRTEEIIDSLRQGTEIVYNDTIFKVDDVLSLDDSMWVAVIDGRDTADAKSLKSLETSTRARREITNSTPDMRREMVNIIANRFKLVQAAESLGLDTLPDMAAIRRNSLLEKSRSVIYAGIHDESWRPTDSMVEKYYNDHIDEYVPSKPFTVRHLVVKDRELADFLRDLAIDGNDLADLAKSFGEEQGLDVTLEYLGNIGREDVSEEYYKKAEATLKGRISRVAIEGDKYYIIEMLERRESMSLAMAQPFIRTKLEEDHRWMEWEGFRDDLFKKYGVRILRHVGAVEVPALSEGRRLSRPTKARP